GMRTGKIHGTANAAKCIGGSRQAGAKADAQMAEMDGRAGRGVDRHRSRREVLWQHLGFKPSAGLRFAGRPRHALGYLQGKETEPDGLYQVKTVSEANDKVVCQADLAMPDKGTIHVEYEFFWEGPKREIKYSITAPQ
ncbi:MAG: hypothetical protein JOZ40_21345, partial [Methylobacteriaceae bacterium]|nr:hypothetical protein [Methylobacteriaceae bacterium]